MSGAMFNHPNMSGFPGAPPPLALKPVGVFWDIENCPTPPGKLASSVIHHIRNTFIINRLNNREYEFLVACDVTKIRKDIPEDINRAGGVTLAHVSYTSKNAADEKLRESMRRFVDTHTQGQLAPLLVLISGDIDFVNDLRAYQTRLGCQIIILHGVSSSVQFKQGWNEIYPFQSFCEAIPTTSAVFGNAETQGQESQRRAGKAGPPNMKGPNQKGPPNKGPSQAVNVDQGKGKSTFIPPKNQGYVNPKQSQIPPRPLFSNQNSSGNANPANKGKKLHEQQQTQTQTYPQKLPKMSGSGGMDQLSKGLKNVQIPDKEEIILMVTGLPGKMDYRILKDHLQEAAASVNGRVKYVKNGQGFITFRKNQDAEKAIALFFGKEVYGNKLSIRQVKSIPFETPRPQPQLQQQRQGRDESSNFEMVNHPQQQHGAAGYTGNVQSDGDSLAGVLGAFAGAAIKEFQNDKKKPQKPKKDPNCVIQ